MNLNTVRIDSNNLQLSATFAASYGRDEDPRVDEPQSFEFGALFAERDDADRFAALFPKSAKFHVVSFRREHGVTQWIVRSETKLLADGINKGSNETGVRRYRSILKSAEKAGVEVEWTAHTYRNSYSDRQSFETALFA